MGAYEDNLRHVAEPQAPSERNKAVCTTIADYEALWLAERLREFAHYADHADDPQVAVAYASYINQKVREEGSSYVNLYAHTQTAAETLMDALYYDCPPSGEREEYPMVIFRSMEDSLAELVAHYIEESDFGTPPDPTVDDEIGVVFDPQAARESYAAMEIEIAEGEAMENR